MERPIVSKTVGRGFEAFFPCHKGNKKLIHEDGFFVIFRQNFGFNLGRYCL